MAGERVLYPEFREELEFTRYPFADGATLTADTGLQIELDTFLDAAIYPLASVGPLYLASIEVTTREITISIGDDSRQIRASATFNPLAPPDLLHLSDSYERPAGVLVSEQLRLARFGAWSAGLHTFARAATTFVATVIIPMPETGVRGLLTSRNELLAGDVWLIGDNGVVVREDNGKIRIDVVGDPLFVRKLCRQVDRFEAPNFVRTINGCPPDLYGNFNLTVGDHMNPATILRIYQSGGALVIEAVGQTTTSKET